MSSILRRLPQRVPPSAIWVHASLASRRTLASEPNRLFARNLSSQNRTAPVVTYEQLKPLTEQPALVRAHWQLLEQNAGLIQTLESLYY